VESVVTERDIMAELDSDFIVCAKLCTDSRLFFASVFSDDIFGSEGFFIDRS